jgi:hypothetical protein
MPPPPNDLILDGRGWSNNDRNSAYDSLNPDDLFDRLGSWSPTCASAPPWRSAAAKGKNRSPHW